MKVSLILGAGFSKCSSIPTQNEFPDYFLSDTLSDSPIHKAISIIIKEYLSNDCRWGQFPDKQRRGLIFQNDK
ncbi:MAG: hypothetical protein ACUZ8N_01920 [Candidatus Scalindua sp.]